MIGTTDTTLRKGSALALVALLTLIAGCVEDPVTLADLDPSFARGGNKDKAASMSLAGGLTAAPQAVDAKDTNRWLTASAGSYEVTFALDDTQNDPGACTVVEDGPVDQNRLLDKLVSGPVTRTLELQFDKDAIDTGLESHDHVLNHWASESDEHVSVQLGRNEAGAGNFLVVSSGPNANEYVLSGGTVRVRLTDKTVGHPYPQGWIRCPLAPGDEVTVTLPANLP